MDDENAANTVVTVCPKVGSIQTNESKHSLRRSKISGSASLQMRQHESANTLQASGQFVLSPLRNTRSKIQLRRVCPRPEDSQQVRECFFGHDNVATPPDFRFKVPNPKHLEGKKWVTHSKFKEVEVDKNTGETFAVSRHAPSPHDSTQVNNLIKQQRNSTKSPSFEYRRKPIKMESLLLQKGNCTENKQHSNANFGIEESGRHSTSSERPLVETILTFRNKWKQKTPHNYSIFSDPQSNYKKTYRVGEHSGVMNNTRPDLALKGVLRSNLPTMEGVLGLGDLNETTWRSVGGVPHERYKVHASAKLHPTYRTIQVEKMLGQEHSDEVLDSLRKRGSTHSPIRQFVQRGQGTANEINWVQQTRKSRLMMKERAKYLDSRIFVENRVHPMNKEMQNLNTSGIYNNDIKHFD